MAIRFHGAYKTKRAARKAKSQGAARYIVPRIIRRNKRRGTFYFVFSRVPDNAPDMV